ncbi:MAG: type II toxin-antitoxin system VapC family toxin [Planctomycetota bacterium]
MIGLDTNVLVRYLTQDDLRQAKAATELIESASSEETFFVSTVVLCELVWVLEVAYEVPRADIHAILEKVLRTAQFRFESSDVLWQALGDYAAGRADFADYVIARVCATYGCQQVVTFDKALKNRPAFRVL